MTSELDSGWTLDLLAAVPLAVFGSIYAVGLAKVRSPNWREAAAFAAGWLTLAVALLSPIASLADLLFSVHMTQHELLILVAAPLVALGRPVAVGLWALPRRWRQGAGKAVRRSSELLAAPALIFLLHGATLWIWHLPALYEAALADPRVHVTQHVMFTATACLFWWTLLRGRFGRSGYGIAVLFVFATALHSGGLGALAALSTRPWYETYSHRAPTGSNPLGDQQLAGLIMWVPTCALLTVIGLALFAAWLGESERRRRIGGLG